MCGWVQWLGRPGILSIRLLAPLPAAHSSWVRFAVGACALSFSLLPSLPSPRSPAPSAPSSPVCRLTLSMYLTLTCASPPSAAASWRFPPPAPASSLSRHTSLPPSPPQPPWLFTPPSVNRSLRRRAVLVLRCRAALFKIPRRRRCRPSPAWRLLLRAVPRPPLRPRFVRLVLLVLVGITWCSVGEVASLHGPSIFGTLAHRYSSALDWERERDPRGGGGYIKCFHTAPLKHYVFIQPPSKSESESSRDP